MMFIHLSLETSWVVKSNEFVKRCVCCVLLYNACFSLRGELMRLFRLLPVLDNPVSNSAI